MGSEGSPASQCATMPVTELGVTYFPALATLAQDAEVGFQYVRVGNWFEPEIAHQALTRFPGKKFLYHHNGNIRVHESETQSFIATLRKWHQHTGCPWLSAHLDYHSDKEIQAILFEGRRPYCYDMEQAIELMCQAVEAVQVHLPVPLLLENMQHWPLLETDLTAMPEFIRRVLDQLRGGLLLDTAHARITAAILGCDVHTYLEELPLHRIIEVHVSSPRYRNGEWDNCHEVLQEADYTLLEWLLEKTTPRVITLEYWKEPDRAREQVLHLNKLIGQVKAA